MIDMQNTVCKSEIRWLGENYVDAEALRKYFSFVECFAAPQKAHRPEESEGYRDKRKTE